jgi:hypothetical protein
MKPTREKTADEIIEEIRRRTVFGWISNIQDRLSERDRAILRAMRTNRERGARLYQESDLRKQS